MIRVGVLVMLVASVAACGGGGDGGAGPTNPTPAAPAKFEGAVEINSPGRSVGFADFPPLKALVGISLEDGTYFSRFPSTGVGRGTFSQPVPTYSERTGELGRYDFAATDFKYANNPHYTAFLNNLGYAAAPSDASFLAHVLLVQDQFDNSLSPPRLLASAGMYPSLPRVRVPESASRALQSYQIPGDFGYVPAEVPSARYVYNKPASLADLAGVWDTSVQIGPSGVLTGSAAKIRYQASASWGRAQSFANWTDDVTTACELSGNMSARRSGKNVFDVRLSLSGAACALAGQTMDGVAIDYLNTDGHRTLEIMAVNSPVTAYASLSLAR